MPIQKTKAILHSEGNEVIDSNLASFETILNMMEEELLKENKDEINLVKLSNLHGKLTGFYREIVYFRTRFKVRAPGRKKKGALE